MAKNTENFTKIKTKAENIQRQFKIFKNTILVNKIILK